MFNADKDDLGESSTVDNLRIQIKSNVGEILLSKLSLKKHDEFDLLSCEEDLMQPDILLMLVVHKNFRSVKAVDMNEKVLIDIRGAIL